MPTAGPKSLQARLRSARWVGSGLLDQILMAVANAGTTLLGLVLLDRHPAGLMVLALGIGYFAMYLNRAFVGDVLVALSSRYDDQRRDDLVRDGLGTALTAGVAGSALFLAIWLTWPGRGDLDLRYLIWIAPFLPAIMLHDTARCSYLAARKPHKALLIDLVWVSVQASVVTLLVYLDAVDVGGLLVAWGFGAVAGSTFFLVRSGVRPWHGSPRRWLRATRHLAGWFTATMVIGQVHLQAVNFIVAVRLTSVEVSGLRFVQTLLMQPVQNLISALQGLLVPVLSRKAHAAEAAGDEGAAAATALRRQTVRLAAGAMAFGVVFVLVVWPLAAWLLSRSGKFADVAPLALPVSLQAACYLVQLPFAAALRGMHRPRSLFVQYVVFSAVGLTGLVVGAVGNGLTGAVWGLATGSFVGLLTMIVLFGFSSASLTPAAVAEAPEQAPEPGEAQQPAPEPAEVPEQRAARQSARVPASPS